jgi:phytanoyl-CoA hydroxylase
MASVATLSTKLNSWDQDGVLILRNLFCADSISEINATVDKLWQDKEFLLPKIVIDTHIQSGQSFRQLLKYTSLESRQYPYKLNAIYLEEPSVRDMILNEALCQHLAALLDGTPMVFNSLNFEYGSQQHNHRDTLFMPPRVANKMVVSWIALEDVSLDNGPVRYYPGSHKIAPFRFSNGKQNAVQSELHEFDAYMKQAMLEREIKPAAFEANAGDVLTWHSELLHGGSAILDRQATRKSLVTHYYRKQDYRHRFWQIKKQHADGCYLKWSHQSI